MIVIQSMFKTPPEVFLTVTVYFLLISFLVHEEQSYRVGLTVCV